MVIKEPVLSTQYFVMPVGHVVILEHRKGGSLGYVCHLVIKSMIEAMGIEKTIRREENGLD